MVRAFLLITLALSTALPAPSAPPNAQDLPDVGTVLHRMSQVAGLYLDEALRFTCDEHIRITSYDLGHRPRSRQEHGFAYVYVFDESSASRDNRIAGLRDYRTELPKSGGSETAAEIDPSELGLLVFLRRAYSWTFIFLEQLAPFYEFRLDGTDHALDRDAIVIAFEAQPPFRVGYNDWIGRMWIDSETYQLLRVEAMTASDVEKKALAEKARQGSESDSREYTFTELTTEFGVEKNGMRFPSRVTLIGTWAGPMPNSRGSGSSFAEYTGFRADQTYTEYRFFSTRTVVEIEAIVRSEAR